jgi:hypothetical protein
MALCIIIKAQGQLYLILPHFPNLYVRKSECRTALSLDESVTHDEFWVWGAGT